MTLYKKARKKRGKRKEGEVLIIVQAPMIAYDALLGAGDNWHELVYRGIILPSSLFLTLPPSLLSLYPRSPSLLLSSSIIYLYRIGVLHGGDNDSTGCIAAAWWGAIYGFQVSYLLTLPLPSRSFLPSFPSSPLLSPSPSPSSPSYFE